MTFNGEEEEDTLVEEGRCLPGTHATVRSTKATFVTSGSCVKRVLTRAMSMWRTPLLPLMKRKMKALPLRKERLPREACFDLGDVNLDKNIVEDILVEEGPQIERGTVFLRGHMPPVRFSKEAVVTSGSRVKRVLSLAMSKWTKHIVTFNEEGGMKRHPWRMNLRLNAHGVSQGHMLP